MCAYHKQAPPGAEDYSRGVERSRGLSRRSTQCEGGSGERNLRSGDILCFSAPSREANAERYGALVISIDCTDVRNNRSTMHAHAKT